MTDFVYYYDGSFEGFLCCIFDSYANKEIPTAIYRDEDLIPTLFSSRSILTDQSHAQRVYRKILKCSPDAADLLRRGFLTCLEDKEIHLYRLVVKLLKEGDGFLRNFSDETLYPVLKAVRPLFRSGWCIGRRDRTQKSRASIAAQSFLRSLPQ